MASRRILFAAILVTSGACAASPSVQGCVTDAECGPGNVCHLGYCAANAAPTAELPLPSAATTHRLLSFVPVVSDPEGGPVAIRWSVRAVVGGCAPEVEARSDVLEVVFWCAGTYELTLVPSDDQGLEGVAVVRSLEVSEVAGPGVTTGGTIDATCQCDTGGGDCYVAGSDGSTSLPLSATVFPVVHWDLSSAPEGMSTASPIWFQPSADVSSPHVSITTGLGETILGTWRFRVLVRDVDGNVGQAFQDVVVSGPCTET